jgi:hypothetical protein
MGARGTAPQTMKRCGRCGGFGQLDAEFFGFGDRLGSYSFGRGDELLLLLLLFCLCPCAASGNSKFLVFRYFGLCLFCGSAFDLEPSLSDRPSASAERTRTWWSMNWSALEFGEKSKVIVGYGGAAVGAMVGGGCGN